MGAVDCSINDILDNLTKEHLHKDRHLGGMDRPNVSEYDGKVVLNEEEIGFLVRKNRIRPVSCVLEDIKRYGLKSTVKNLLQPYTASAFYFSPEGYIIESSFKIFSQEDAKILYLRIKQTHDEK